MSSLAPLRWLMHNLSTLLLALILAMVVWVSAVLTADPNVVQTSPPIPLEILGQDTSLLLVGDVPSEVRLTLRAPQSVWNQLSKQPELMHAWIDLSGLGAGEHTLKVQAKVDLSPVRYLNIDPSTLVVKLEPLVRREYIVEVIVKGELPVGYTLGNAVVRPSKVVVSGPQSAMERIASVRVEVDVSGKAQTVEGAIEVEALDENNRPIEGVNIAPQLVELVQPISLLGGFKNVVVKVVTQGQVAEGYRLTNISVSPPTVTLFSDDPTLLEEVPGFVETLPVVLDGLNDDREFEVSLNLPEGVTSVRAPTVLVQVSVAAIEGSLTLTLPVEIIGLSPELDATISPATVDVIIAGPLNVLEKLTPEDFRVVLDLSGLPAGVYQRAPVVDLYPPEVRIQTTLPETLEVTIVLAPTPTPTPTTSTTPSITVTLTPTPKKTPQP